MRGDDATQRRRLGVDRVQPDNEVAAARMQRERDQAGEQLDCAVALHEHLQVTEGLQLPDRLVPVVTAEGVAHQHGHGADHVPQVSLVRGSGPPDGLDARGVELAEVYQGQRLLHHGPSRLRVDREVDRVGESDRLAQPAELPQDAHLLGDAHRADDVEAACLDDRLDLLPRLPFRG